MLFVLTAAGGAWRRAFGVEITWRGVESAKLINIENASCFEQIIEQIITLLAVRKTLAETGAHNLSKRCHVYSMKQLRSETVHSQCLVWNYMN